MKKLNIRPDTGVYGTYKRISYEPWTALAEFVDNSTQSYYDNKTKLEETKYWKGLVIDMQYIENSKDGDQLIISDNAYGMEYADFQRAIILDRPPLKTSGRNEFGMGLKAAACWFGDLWSVETTALGSDVKYKAEIDIESLIKYKNEEIDVMEEHANKKEHGTTITIKKLHKKIKGKRIEKKIHELLSSIYRVDLRSGDIKIYYNEKELIFDEVKPYIDNKGKEYKEQFDFKVPFKEGYLSVRGFVGIRIPGSPRDAGFTLIRRGRVIVGGPEKNYRPSEIFGASNSFPYQRLFDEIIMDDWPVTQAKDAFDWNNEDLESRFIDMMKNVSDNYKKISSEIRTRETMKIGDIAEQLKSSLPENDKFADVCIEVNNNIESNSIFIKDDLDSSGDYTKESEGIGVDIQGNHPIIVKFTYDKKGYKFTIILDGNSNSQWLKVSSNDEKPGEFELIINSSHLFFYPFIQKKDFLSILIKFAIALVLSEVDAYKIGDGKIMPSTIRIGIGKILEELSNVELI